MVIAYLMRYERLSLTHAMEVCGLARPAARPREIFLRDLVQWEEQLIEKHGWDTALALATEEAVLGLNPVDPGASKEEVKAECRKLVAALQQHCIRETFGDAREPTWQLREAA